MLAGAFALFVALGAVAQESKEELMDPEEAFQRMAAGEAILIDVREPEEWKDGVAAGAFLLPLSDLKGERRQWDPILETNRDKELILYCRSGNRSGQAAKILEDKGFDVANIGGFRDWKAAGQPVDQPEAPEQ